jgi:hypothetical protein
MVDDARIIDAIEELSGKGFPPTVREDGSGRPAAFRGRGRWYKVESVALVRPGIYNTWEPDRWRVFTRDGGVFELARDKDKKWMLWRVWD